MSAGVFIGRFQPLHDGHIRCIEHILARHDRCTVYIRDTARDEKNPLGFAARAQMIQQRFPQVRVERLDDPDADLTVYIGRDVGYDLIRLDAATEAISATDIRSRLYR